MSMYFGPYFPLIIGIMLLSFIVQGYLSRTYGKWGQVRNPRNLTGAEVARMRCSTKTACKASPSTWCPATSPTTTTRSARP